MPRVRVVLVRPETAANIGACARVVRNTGAAGLDLVEPGDWRTVECWRAAWGAQDVLEQARVLADLGAALAGAAITVAFTARRAAAAVEDVRTAAAAIAALGPEEEAALVFGPETHGLSNAEIAACGRAATIPSHHGQPSYNLSHAVAIAAYEVHRARRPSGGDSPPRQATHDEKERLLALLREGLLAIGALPPANLEGTLSDWRALVQRCPLSAHELRLLEHVARRMARGRG